MTERRSYDFPNPVKDKTLTAMGQRCPSCSHRSTTRRCECWKPCGWDRCVAAEADEAFERAGDKGEAPHEPWRCSTCVTEHDETMPHDE